MLRTLILTAVALILAGCAQPVAAPGGGSKPLVGDFGPGQAQADGVTASVFLSEVCLDTLPDFRKAPQVLARFPFRQNATTGTYYHQNLDLSIKIFDGRCSMVFSSTEEAAQLGIIMGVTAGSKGTENSLGIDPNTGASATVTKGGAGFEFTPTSRSNGRNYYRAVVIAK